MKHFLSAPNDALRLELVRSMCSRLWHATRSREVSFSCFKRSSTNCVHTDFWLRACQHHHETKRIEMCVRVVMWSSLVLMKDDNLDYGGNP